MSDFNDMQHRIILNGFTPVRYTPSRPGCWPYGELIVSDGDGETFNATFGDLTMEVTPYELLKLILLATRSDVRSQTGLLGILGLAKVPR